MALGIAAPLVVAASAAAPDTALAPLPPALAALAAPLPAPDADCEVPVVGPPDIDVVDTPDAGTVSLPDRVVGAARTLKSCVLTPSMDGNQHVSRYHTPKTSLMDDRHTQDTRRLD